jgi:hypothetical protein
MDRLLAAMQKAPSFSKHVFSLRFRTQIDPKNLAGQTDATHQAN